jgi:hypothetical protein
MKRMIKILAISLVIGGILAAVLAGTVLAAGPAGGPKTAQEDCGAAGLVNGNGLGFGPDSEIADLLGMTPEEIREQRQDGKSLADIALSFNGTTEQELINIIMAEKKEAIQKLVAAETITQAEADARLLQMAERVRLAVERTMTGPPVWAGENGKGQKGQAQGNGAYKGNGQGKGRGGMEQRGSRGGQAGGGNTYGNSGGDQIQGHSNLY